MKGTSTLRLLFLSAGFLFLSLMAQAQMSWHIGLTAGPQFNMMSSNIGSYKGGIGFNGGLANEIRFGPRFSVEVDNIYSVSSVQRKYKDSMTFYTTQAFFNYNNAENFSYLQNMLLLRYNLVLDGPVILPYDFDGPPHTWLTFFAGPSYNMVMGYSRGAGSTFYTVNGDGDTSVSKPLSLADTVISKDKSKYIASDEIGVVVGAGINFRIGKTNTLGFEARYHMGMTSMDRGYFGTPMYNNTKNPHLGYKYAEIKNSAISLQISYKVKLVGSKYE